MSIYGNGHRMCTTVLFNAIVKYVLSTVWPEILAGRYYGGLLKICHLAEFTLAVEPVLSHNDIHSKMAN